MKLFISLILYIFCSFTSSAQCGYYFKILTSSFNKVKFWDESNGVILGYNASLLSTHDGGKHWQNANIPMFQSINLRPLNDIAIADPTTGYVVGDEGFLLKTIDKGRTWKRLVGIKGDEDFKGAYFWNSESGIIVGPAGLLYKTTDGGNSWRKIAVPYNGDFGGVCFADSRRGFAWGRGGDVTYPRTLTTTDGGETWQILPGLNDRFVTKMQFVSSSVGYLSVQPGAPLLFTPNGIYKTTDGGLTWTVPAVNNFHAGLVHFSFTDPNTGFVAFSDLVKKTADGAVNFSQSFDLNKYTFNDIHFVNTNVGYAVGTSNGFIGGSGRFLVKTTDGGNNWNILDTLHKQIENSSSNRNILDFYELSPTTKFISCSDLTIPSVFSTRDGGSTWQTDTILSRDEVRGTGYLLKNGTLVFNSRTNFYTSVDSGKNWTSHALNVPDPAGFDFGAPFPISWISADTFFLPAVTTSGTKIYYTTNKASSWSTITIPSGFTSATKKLFTFINKDTAFIAGYAVGSIRRIYRTYDRGITWQNLNYPDSMGFGEHPIDPDLINDSTIMVRSLDKRSFYKTRDRGNTWTTLQLPPGSSSDLFINMFDFYSEQKGAFADNTPTIFTTNDGGQSWFMQITGYLISSTIRGVSFTSPDRYFAFGNDLRLEQYQDYIPGKPSLIRGPTVVKKDSLYDYIIPLDLFSFDTKWEATGNAQLLYDSTSPERVRIKWSSAGNFKVTAIAKNRCGSSDAAEISVTVTPDTVPGNTVGATEYVLFPIPTQNILYLKFNQPNQADFFTVSDISGRVLISKKINSLPLIEINMEAIAAGTYILTVFSKNGTEKSVRKIIKQ